MKRSISRLGVLALVLAAVLAVVVVLRLLPQDQTYRAELYDAAGLRSGDDVRLAGLRVGEVTGVSARGDTVHVDFTADPDVRLTEDTSTEVKLLSLLGQRYLSLTPGEGATLDAGGTIARTSAVDVYSIDRFFLESTPTIQDLDLHTLERAIDTLSGSLEISPADVRSALDGMTRVAEVVAGRSDQLDRLLSATRSVTGTLVSQQDQIVALAGDADLVLRMVLQRREAIRALLAHGRELVQTMTDLARTNSGRLAKVLEDAHLVLDSLRQSKDQLDELLRVSGPSMRLFTNSTGDGPWLGVNSPTMIVPDDFVCMMSPKVCQ